MSDQSHNPALNALESKLTSLTPLPSALDRDYLLYHAGRASVRGSGWFSRAVTGFLLLVTAGLSLALLVRPVQRPEPQVIEKIVRVPAETMPPPAPPSSGPVNPAAPHVAAAYASDNEYVKEQADNARLRQQAFRFGVDSLPPPYASTVAEKPLPLDPLLGLPASTLDDASGRLLLGTSLHSGY
jgi:hypothetical protein